jgi:hypothetical protein
MEARGMIEIDVEEEIEINGILERSNTQDRGTRELK